MPHHSKYLAHELIPILLFLLYSERCYAEDKVALLPDSTLVKVKVLLISNESMSLKPYRDTRNRLTIGVGRNLEENGITQAEALMLLENDINRVSADCTRNFPWFKQLNETRQIVLINMVFNMGMSHVLEFSNMLQALAMGNYVSAASEMLRSNWAKQVHRRAINLALAMKTGVLVAQKKEH